MHWADKAALLLLLHFVRPNARSPLLVLAIYRDTDLHRQPSVPRRARRARPREPGVELVSLVGLDPDDVFDLLEAIAGHELDADGRLLGDLLLAETDGNPYFVTETLRHLAETGAIARSADGHWSATHDLRTVGLPVTVREVITRRVACLGSEVHQLLGFAAVLGRDFDVDILLAVSGVDDYVLSTCSNARLPPRSCGRSRSAASASPSSTR